MGVPVGQITAHRTSVSSLIRRPPRPRLVEEVGKLGRAELPPATERSLNARQCFDGVTDPPLPRAIAIGKIKPEVFGHSPARERIGAGVLNVIPCQ
jgi:hypothetical protein